MIFGNRWEEIRHFGLMAFVKHYIVRSMRTVYHTLTRTTHTHHFCQSRSLLLAAAAALARIPSIPRLPLIYLIIYRYNRITAHE